MLIANNFMGISGWRELAKDWMDLGDRHASSLLFKRPYIPGHVHSYLSAIRFDAKWEAFPYVEGLLLSPPVWITLKSWRLIELKTWSCIDGIKLRRGRRSPWFGSWERWFVLLYAEPYTLWQWALLSAFVVPSVIQVRSISGFTSIYCESYTGLIFLQPIEWDNLPLILTLEERPLSEEEESSDPTVFFNLQLLSRHSDFFVAAFFSHMDLAKDPLSSQNQIFDSLKYIIGNRLTIKNHNN